MKWTFVLLVLSLPSLVHGQVTSVTLYPSHAQLTWDESVQVAAGNGEITVTGLPVSLQDETLMAQIRGIEDVLIQRVQIRQVEQAEAVADTTRELLQALREVEQKIGAREDEIQAWNQQVKLMTEAAAKPGEATASELALLAKTVQQTTQEALARIRALKLAMADDIAERDRLERELQATRQDAKATKNVTVVYKAGKAGQGRIQLSYQSPAASWQSRYNARLETADSGTEGKVALEHVAVIRQSTGLDWQDVKLTLSTANARLGTDIPPLHPWVVSPGTKIDYRSKSALGSSMDMVQAEALNSAPAAQLINEGAFTQSYRVATPVTLSSSRAEQFVTVDSHSVQVAIETRFLPAMDLNGFVHAAGKFAGTATLPPGPVTLYRDGQSVGSAFMDSVSAGSELSLGFGVNDRVTAEIVNKQDQQGEQGIFKGEKYVRRAYQYEITNNHPRAVAVRVFDRIPVSRQDELTVETLDISQPVTRDFKDMKGILSWERTIQPGKTVILNSGFELRVPEDSELPPEFQI